MCSVVSGQNKPSSSHCSGELSSPQQPPGDEDYGSLRYAATLSLHGRRSRGGETSKKVCNFSMSDPLFLFFCLTLYCCPFISHNPSSTSLCGVLKKIDKKN
ncbi:hypothetical protein AMECASPLE_011712 [Ameca splendens]|uniref:Uncharacterized protein n=1 Tax=Ameca splendens TaxID=208324 RepID=A0ABV0YBS4_9TELE